MTCRNSLRIFQSLFLSHRFAMMIALCAHRKSHLLLRFYYAALSIPMLWRKAKHCAWLDIINRKTDTARLDVTSSDKIAIELSRSTFYNFIIVQFVRRNKKRRGTPTCEYWSRNRCSRQAFRFARRIAERGRLSYKRALDFGVNLWWRLRRKQ